MNANISLATDLTTAVNTGPGYETIVTQAVDDANVPAWDGGTTYIVGDLVTQGGSTYVCILGHTNQSPPNGTYWAVAVTQDYAAWFKYTAQADDVVVGANAYATIGGHTGYRPAITVFLGPTSAPTEWNPSGNSSDLDVGHNQSVQTPVTPVTTYYFRVYPDNSSSGLTELSFRMTRGPQETVPKGSLFINDDTAGFPAVYLDVNDGHALKFVGDITNGEHGSTLPDGTFALTNDQTADPLAVIVYDKDRNVLGSVALTNSAGTVDLRSDGVDAFYVSQLLTGASDTVVRKISNTGTLLDTWTVTGEEFDIIAVDPELDIMYYGIRDNTASIPIKRYDLANSVTMSDFATVTGQSHWFDWFVVADNQLLAVFSATDNSDFFARLFTSGGATVRDFAFTPPASRTDGPRSAWDHNDTLWMWSSGITDGDRLSHFEAYRISDGTQLHSFDSFVFQAGNGPAGGSGNDPDVQRFGNAKSCPLLVAGATILAPETDNATECPCPCDCPGPTPGTGETGPGSPGVVEPPVNPTVWEKSCDGGGLPPMAPDVEDSEDWGDETPPKEPDSWFVIYGPVNSEDPRTDQTHWSWKPLSDVNRFMEPRLIEMSLIERRSSDKEGNYTPSQVRVVAQDDDGAVRTMLVAPTTEQLIHREARVSLLSRAGRKAGLDAIILMQGRVIDVQPTVDKRVTVEMQDIVGSHLGILNPEKTIGIPIGDEHPNKPETTKGKIYPIILGEHSDVGQLDADGNPADIGMLPAFYCGDGWMACALGEVDIHEVYGSDGTEDGIPAKRTRLEWGGGIIDGPYTREVGGILQTGFYVTEGSLALQRHLDGSVTFAWNGCGWHDDDGLVIDQAYHMLLMVLNEAVEKNNGLGYRTGAFGPIEEFLEGAPKFWTSKFVEAQEKTIEWIGGLGYIGAIAIVEPTSLSTFLQRFFISFGGYLTTNLHGQIYPYVIDKDAVAASPSSEGRAYRERIEIARVVDHRYERSETENRVVYNWRYNFDRQEWKNIGAKQEDAQSIADHGGDRIGLFQMGLKECFYDNDEATVTDRWARHLGLYSYAPRYCTWETSLKSIPDRNGDSARLWHRKEGLGAIGEAGTPGVLMHTAVGCYPYFMRQTAMLFEPVLNVETPAIEDIELIADGSGDPLSTEDGFDVLVLDGA